MTQIIAVALVALGIACGAPPKPRSEPLIENVEATEACCCRIETATPDDPTFAQLAVMECSVRDGTCLQTTAQCEAQPGGPDEPGPSGSAETPTSF